MPHIKPLETKEMKGKRDKRRGKIIMGLVIAIIMVASSIGYAILDSERTVQGEQSYRDYQFVTTDMGWQTQININNQNILLNTFYLPQEVENISSSGTPLLADFMDKVIYLVATTDTERQSITSYSALGKIALRMQLACSKEQENSTFCTEANLPIKSCDDVDWQTAIIMFQELNESSNNSATINYKNSCLEVKGKGIELVKASEKALFQIFGIIE